MRCYARTGGVLIEPMGHVWAAFSPATGETSLLNDETVSILEVLSLETATTEVVCTSLSADTGLGVDVLMQTVEASWPRLIEAGLVREQHADGAITQ
jgi:hypothetical protein